VFSGQRVGDHVMTEVLDIIPVLPVGWTDLRMSANSAGNDAGQKRLSVDHRSAGWSVPRFMMVALVAPAVRRDPHWRPWIVTR
jgi:hypothetical protein